MSLFLLLSLSACQDSDEGIVEGDLTVPPGYALSAGTATVFTSSSFAYDSEADWVKGELKRRFTRGDKLYDDARTSANGLGGGLGPVYAGYSCGSCHRNAGRTKPALWTQTGTDPDGTPVYGSGSYGFSSMLVYVTRKNGAFFPDYGRVIHDQSVYGVQAEGKLEFAGIAGSFSSPTAPRMSWSIRSTRSPTGTSRRTAIRTNPSGPKTSSAPCAFPCGMWAWGR